MYLNRYSATGLQVFKNLALISSKTSLLLVLPTMYMYVYTKVMLNDLKHVLRV